MLSDRLLGFLRELERSLISYVIMLPMAVGKQRKNPRCVSVQNAGSWAIVIPPTSVMPHKAVAPSPS